ncbi:MAG TPA: hypothetical protein VNI02_16590 [Blastocatellia bacterium]|nr:hypothetical protein [Blastocatellia bacterium]
MSAKYESASLILKLYEARREETMRKARDWFLTFLPNSAQEVTAVFLGPHSAYYRMVTTYWEMAASFVNHGAIDEQMFNDANGEQVAVFAKIEPYIEELRAMYGAPEYLKNLEQLVMRRPGAKELMATARERIRTIVAQREAAKENT